MILKAYSSRNNLQIKDLNKDFDKEIFEYDDGEKEFTFYGGFNLFIGAKKVANVNGIFFDESKIDYEYEYGNIVDIANIINDDVYNAIGELFKSKIYEQEINDDKAFSHLYTCYISQVYIFP
jgi:hypothetical protein